MVIKCSGLDSLLLYLFSNNRVSPTSWGKIKFVLSFFLASEFLKYAVVVIFHYHIHLIEPVFSSILSFE